MDLLLSGNECTARLRKRCKKLVNRSTEEINPYLKDDTKTNNIESLCRNLGGQKSKLLNMTRLPWRIILTSQQDLKEAKREFKRLHDEHVKNTQQEYIPILVINNHDNEEDKHSKESTSTTIESILEPAGGSIVQSHKETCHGLTIREICSLNLGPDSVGPEINFPTIDGKCEQNTHSYSMY